MKNNSMLRVLALVVVLSMIFTTAVFATPGNKKIDRNEESYKVAVESMIEKQIMRGYGHGDYGLEGNVKRGDVIVMIVRAFDITITDEDLVEDFADITEDEYFYKPVKAAKKLGIAKGDGKYFNPNKPVTVQEAIWLIGRAEEIINLNFDKDVEIEDLYDLFEEGELNKFAKRKDIALMLHYAMTGEEDYEDDEEDKDDEIDDIKFEIDEDKVLKFTSDSNSDKTIEEILDSLDLDIEYVKFDYPKNGTLYYEYNADSSENELVSENAKYYLDGSDKDLLEKITFVPKKDFNGTVTISYNAYDDEDEYFSGKIVITVGDEKEATKDLALIKYTINENTVKEFEDDLDSDMDEFKFVLPDNEEGTLYVDSDLDDKVVEGKLYADEKFEQITFVPAQDFSGVVEIKYTAIDGEEIYSGLIKITIKEVQEIKTMELSVEEEDALEIDFEEKLDALTERGKIFTQAIFDSIDYVTFELPAQGELLIKMSGDSNYKDVHADEDYDIDDIDGLKYVPVDDSDSDDELVEIKFTAFVESDKNGIADKEYNGVIEITVVD